MALVSENIIDKLTNRNKLFIGFAVIVVSAIIGSVSMAGASHNPTPPTNKEDCKKGGFVEYGFKNQGQCVSASVRAQNGGGYGGNQEENNTNIRVNNDSDQDATSGDATVSGNTNGGDASTGSASNSNTTSTSVNLSF